jgi:hypothetical protein
MNNTSFEVWYNNSPIHAKFTQAREAVVSAEAHISESLRGRDPETEDFHAFWGTQCDVIKMVIEATEARLRLMMRSQYFPEKGKEVDVKETSNE